MSKARKYNTAEGISHMSVGTKLVCAHNTDAGFVLDDFSIMGEIIEK